MPRTRPACVRCPFSRTTRARPKSRILTSGGLAGKGVAPELIQSDFTAEKVAAQVSNLLDDPCACEAMTAELRALKSRLGPGGAIERAADAVVRMLEPSAVGVDVA